MKEFEELLERAANEIANPQLPVGFEERTMRRLAGSEAVLHLMTEVPSQGVFASLWQGIAELVWPEKLGPLLLESPPVAVPDIFASTRDSRSMMWAVLAHMMVVMVIGWVVEARTGIIRTMRPMERMVALNAPPPNLPPRAETAGGGGGQRGMTPVTHGHLPKFSQQQIVPPKAPPLDQPRIAIEPTVEVEKGLKMADSALPNLGVPNSPLVGLSMGNGQGGGIGGGIGNGIGPGSNGGTGGGVRRVGGGISEPQVLFQPEAEFSDEARKAKFSGNVVVSIWVDEHGNPTHLRVARGVGLGLDEKALDAVRQYKFRPAMQNGKPVTVEMYVDVEFHIY